MLSIKQSNVKINERTEYWPIRLQLLGNVFEPRTDNRSELFTHQDSGFSQISCTKRTPKKNRMDVRLREG